MSAADTDAGLPRSSGISSASFLAVGLIGLVLAALLVLNWTGVMWIVGKWGKPEYSHGPMIPIVALYLVWLRGRDLEALPQRAGAWVGFVVVLLSLAVGFLGDRSASVTISQYAVLLGIWGLALAAVGVRGLKILWVPLLYLAFIIPLPEFIEARLTSGMQLISSQIGVAVIRLAGHSVFLEGNVIDLGAYKLQVAEACSGMRYLFPLLSFGYLCAVLFRGRWWQRAILLVSTIPITIFMNSFRIGVIGILVNLYGIEQAEGFLHDFEGWVVFMASVAVLFFEVWIFARMEGKPFLTVFGLDVPAADDGLRILRRVKLNRQVVASSAIVGLAVLGSLVIGRPPVLVPERASLATFPLRVGAWSGQEQGLELIYETALKTTDYFLGTFSRGPEDMPTGVWIAYYDSQVQGAAVHSPQACLPGGGWRIEQFSKMEVPSVLPDGRALSVNRAVVAMDDRRQIVYYWFAQRGRVLTNEFAVKWFLFWDGLTMNRTDGALVRLTTYVPESAELPEVEARLQEFLRTLYPQLGAHLPDANAPAHLQAPVLVDSVVR